MRAQLPAGGPGEEKDDLQRLPLLMPQFLRVFSILTDEDKI